MKPRLRLMYMTPEHVRRIADAFPDDGPYLIGRGADPRSPAEIEAERAARMKAANDAATPRTVPTAAE